MTNEEAATLIQSWLDGDPLPNEECLEHAVKVLRSPAPGAAAMREACLNAVRKCNVIGSRGSADGWFGGVLAALEQVEADIRALPAPEVPDRTRFLHALDEWHEGYGDVLWWRFPIVEPPHLGSPLETDWKDGYYTHWTEFAVPEKSSWPK